MLDHSCDCTSLYYCCPQKISVLPHAYLFWWNLSILTVLLFWRYFFFLTLGFLKLGSGEFLGNVSNLLNKGKSVIPPLFNSQEVLSSASDKAKLSAENFSKNSDLDNSGIYHNMFSLLELI